MSARWIAVAVCACALLATVCGVLLAPDGPPARAADNEAAVPKYDLAGISASDVLPKEAPSEPGYFPEMVPCGWLLNWLPPPDHLLMQAPAEAPTPLFLASMKSVAECALKPEWLPVEPTTWFLAHGEGAYRARTAHLCWAYEANGSRVVAKGFAGQFEMFIEPPPVTIPPAVEEVLRSAPGWVGNPCAMIGSATYPWKDDAATVPGPVSELLAQLRDAMLTPAAGLRSSEHWEKRVKRARLQCGGLGISYLVQGPIADPGLGGDVPGIHTASLWTNGRVLKVSIAAERLREYTELFRAMAEATPLPVPAWLSIDAPKAWAQSWWCTAGGKPVPTRDEATHEMIRVQVSHKGRYRVMIPLPVQPEDVEQAFWLCFADDRTRMVEGFSYQEGATSYRAETMSIEDFATWLHRQSELCLAAAGELREAGAPESLAATRAELLEMTEPVEHAWQIALEEWEKTVREHEGRETSPAAFVASVGERRRAEGLTDDGSVTVPHRLLGAAAEELGLIIQ